MAYHQQLAFYIQIHKRQGARHLALPRTQLHAAFSLLTYLYLPVQTARTLPEV